MNILSLFFGKSVPEIRALDLHMKMRNGNKPFVLDVRQPEEYRLEHIPGAKLIPLGELNRRTNEVPKGREIVCICATGHRSLPAVRQLAAAGYHASSMKNGMIAWKLAKLPTKKGMSS
jgi:rhodanese-related sulfurtransferase